MEILDSGINSNNLANTTKTWDLKGLRNETSRQYLRTVKKISKLNDKILGLQAKGNSIEQSSIELEDLKRKVVSLREMEESLKSIKSSDDERFSDMIDQAVKLNISDTSPPRPERGPKKVKDIKTSKPRLPYFKYISKDNIEIRVGRRAEDNDELSCNPLYRDSSNWWMHAAGCPGSHIVIRSDDDEFPQKYRETLKDAALLAAINSKANQSGKVSVSLTRCRNLSKPRNAKPGLLQLNGDVMTVSVDVKTESVKRLEYLTQVDD